jgi:hypothetical protein
MWCFGFFVYQKAPAAGNNTAGYATFAESLREQEPDMT